MKDKIANDIFLGSKKFDLLDIELACEQDFERWLSSLKNNPLDVSKLSIYIHADRMENSLSLAKKSIELIQYISSMQSFEFSSLVKPYAMTAILNEKGLSTLEELLFDNYANKDGDLILSQDFFEVDLVEYLHKNKNLKHLGISGDFDLNNYPRLREAIIEHPSLYKFNYQSHLSNDPILTNALQKKCILSQINPEDIPNIVIDNMLNKAMRNLTILISTFLFYHNDKRTLIPGWLKINPRIKKQNLAWDELSQFCTQYQEYLKDFETNQSLIEFSKNILNILAKIAYLEKNKEKLYKNESYLLEEFWDSISNMQMIEKKLCDIHLHRNQTSTQLDFSSEFKFVNSWLNMLQTVPDMLAPAVESKQYFIFYKEKLCKANVENLLKIFHNLDKKLVNNENFQDIDFEKNLESSINLDENMKEFFLFPIEKIDNKIISNNSSEQLSCMMQESKFLSEKNKLFIIDNFISLISELTSEEIDPFLDNLFKEIIFQKKQVFPQNHELYEKKTTYYLNKELLFNLKNEKTIYQHPKNSNEIPSQVSQHVEEEITSKQIEKELFEIKLQLNELLTQYIVKYPCESDIFKDILQTFSHSKEKNISEMIKMIFTIHLNEKISSQEKMIRYFFILSECSESQKMNPLLKKYYFTEKKALHHGYMNYLMSDNQLNIHYMNVAEAIKTLLKDCPTLSASLLNPSNLKKPTGKSLDILDFAKSAHNLLSTKNSGSFYQGKLKEEIQKEIKLITLLKEFYLGNRSIMDVKEQIISFIEEKQKKVSFIHDIKF